MEIGERSEAPEETEAPESVAQHTLVAATHRHPSTTSSSSDPLNPNPNMSSAATATASPSSALKRSGTSNGSFGTLAAATSRSGSSHSLNSTGGGNSSSSKRIKLESSKKENSNSNSAISASSDSENRASSSVSVSATTIQQKKEKDGDTESSTSAAGRVLQPDKSRIPAENENKDESSTTVAAATATSNAPGVTLISPAVEQEEDHEQQTETAPSAAVIKEKEQQKDNGNEESAPPPHKATHFRHLRQKYLGQLEYMLREFQKLEKQLRGAAASAESAGSRERREKLHSFIQHLEETVQQIVTGVGLEEAGQPTYSPPVAEQQQQQDTALHTSSLSREKEQEENVQRLEEHILANLLPVQVRLKKQLAAQQGAKHNPAGMPAVRGGSLQAPSSSSANYNYLQPQGKATFLKAAPPPPSEQPLPLPPTQFGKPLEGGGSSLTQKLHGDMLGCHSRSQGAGVGQRQNDERTTTDSRDVASAAVDGKKDTAPKILYGGLALGSQQIQSSLSAANSVHKVVIRNPDLLLVQSEAHAAMIDKSCGLTPTSVDTAMFLQDLDLKPKAVDPCPLASSSSSVPHDSSGYYDLEVEDDMGLSQSAKAAILSYEERRKLRKKRHRRKKRLRQQQQAAAAAAAARQPKQRGICGTIQSSSGAQHRGPRNVEYTCALCNEVYNSTCDVNPWWALAQHECPKCRKAQIPRVDIAAAANAIEYHPALLAHADDNNAAPEAVLLPPPPPPAAAAPTVPASDNGSGDESDLSDDGLFSDDDYDDDDNSDDSGLSGDDSSDPENYATLSPADQAEHERFGLEYQGPLLPDERSSALLTLMLHASTCPCRHTNEINREVCRSTKWMMLHVRDCPGTTATFDVCPFPWCRKVKHLLFHLVSCPDAEHCKLCSGVMLPRNMRQLQCLNAHRGKKYHRALVAKSKAAAETTKAKARIGGNGSKPRATAAAAAGATKPAPSGMAAATIAPTEPQPNLGGFAGFDGSSNSLAALAAAADALDAEDLATASPLETEIMMPETVPVATKTKEEAGTPSTTVDAVAPSVSATAPLDVVVELESDATTGGAVQEKTAAAAAVTEQPTSAVDLASPVKLEDQSDSPTDQACESTAAAALEEKKGCDAAVKDEGAEENSGECVEATQPEVSVDKGVDNGKSPAEPLRVQ